MNSTWFPRLKHGKFHTAPGQEVGDGLIAESVAALCTRQLAQISVFGRQPLLSSDSFTAVHGAWGWRNPGNTSVLPCSSGFVRSPNSNLRRPQASMSATSLFKFLGPKWDWFNTTNHIPMLNKRPSVTTAYNLLPFCNRRHLVSLICTPSVLVRMTIFFFSTGYRLVHFLNQEEGTDFPQRWQQAVRPILALDWFLCSAFTILLHFG